MYDTKSYRVVNEFANNHMVLCVRLGFPAGWTDPGEIQSTKETPYDRRSAVGNAFAVPAVARLLFALTMALSVPESSAYNRWSGGLQQLYFHDILDDVLEPIQKISSKYGNLTCEFEEYIPSDWTDRLIGPDPGARGRRNRAQRAAALANQTGTSR